MTVNSKLDSILTIKNQIKNIIKAKGIYINNNTPFSQYPNKIRLINGEADTTPPIIESFSIVGNADKTATITGKAEAGAIAILKNPNNVKIRLTNNSDGSFSGTVATKAVEGIYTLIVTDIAGNITTETRDLIFPFIDYPLLYLTESSQGVYFDFTDISTMFQDAAGTIPVTTVGQIIGCIKDKSGKGYKLIQATASRQPKLGRNATTGSYAILFDGSDDFMLCTLASPFNYVNATMIVAAEYRSNVYGFLSVGFYDSSSTWGLALISNFSSKIIGGVRYSLSPTSFVYPTEILYGDSTYMGDTVAMTIGNNLTTHLSTNVKKGVSKDPTNYSSSLNTLLLDSITKGSIYKVFIINRILTDTEITLVREQFNKTMGV